MAQELYELPEGWEWKRLESAAQLGADRKFIPTINSNGEVPFVSMADIDQESGMKSAFELRKFEKVKTGYTKFQKNAVLVAKITPCTENNKTALIHNLDGGYATTEVYAVHPREIVYPKYLLYFFRSPSVRELLISTMEGATGRQRVPTSAIKELFIPICSIVEQTRVVNKLEALLSRIDQAIATLKHSLELTDALFASSLNQAFNPLGAPLQADGTYQLPDGWEWKALSDVFAIARGGSPRPIKSYITGAEDGVNWIKIGDAKQGDKYITSTKEKIKPEGISKSRMVYPGDFILSNSMSFGRPYIMKTQGCIHDGWLVLSPMGQSISTDFMYQLLSSPFAYQCFSNAAAGTTVKNLNSELVRKTRMPIPPLEAQEKITEKMDLIQTKTQASKAALNAKLTQLEQLKASLLDAAFRGEL